MTATEILQKIESPDPIGEEYFNQLIKDFQNRYLSEKKYDERVGSHRNPVVVQNEILQESYDYVKEIGGRIDMQDKEIKNGISIHGNVITSVKLIWEANKTLKSLYNSVKEYCKLTSKDFNTIAVHIAEHRGIEKVGAKIRRDKRKIETKAQAKVVSKNSESEMFSSSLLTLRETIMSRLPPQEMLGILAAQRKISKVTSTYDLILQAAQNQQSASTVFEALIKAKSLEPRTIRGSLFFSKMFDFRLVPKPEAGKYFDFFELLLKTGFQFEPAEIINKGEDPELIEVEYDFSQSPNENPDTVQDEERLIITLNESQRIKEIILDIYNNNTQLLQLESREFEELIAELLSSQGFKVELTKQTRDGGYDILAIHQMANQAPQKWLVECKKFTDNKVGIGVIRSFKEVVQAQFANRGIIATTSYFSRDARKKQQETPYLLDFRDKDAVMKWIIAYGNQNSGNIIS